MLLPYEEYALLKGSIICLENSPWPWEHKFSRSLIRFHKLVSSDKKRNSMSKVFSYNRFSYTLSRHRFYWHWSCQWLVFTQLVKDYIPWSHHNNRLTVLGISVSFIKLSIKSILKFNYGNYASYNIARKNLSANDLDLSKYVMTSFKSWVKLDHNIINLNCLIHMYIN